MVTDLKSKHFKSALVQKVDNDDIYTKRLEIILLLLCDQKSCPDKKYNYFQHLSYLMAKIKPINVQ